MGDDVSAALLDGPVGVPVGGGGGGAIGGSSGATGGSGGSGGLGPYTASAVTPEVPEPESEPPSEIDILDPQYRFMTLQKNNVDIEIVPLETRQLFRFMRIITHGMGARLGNIDFASGSEAFMQQLMTMVFLAIPDAEDETLEFLRAMVQPQGLAGKSKPASQLTKQERETNEGLWNRLNEALFNPNPFDLVNMVERIVKYEAPNMQSLGKQVLALLPAAWRSQVSQAAAES